MAKNNNLTDFLTGVAGAIRAKKGTTALIDPQDFESEIASISGSGKEEQEKNVTITANGSSTVQPDSGKVLSKVNLTVNVPSESKEEQEKSITVTENGSSTVQPDSGKVLSKVTINTNVQPDLEEKTITVNANGTQEITPTSGKDGISKVNLTVDVPSSGGGTDLNIYYGETAPEDTSTLWIKSSEPDNITFTANPEQSIDGIQDDLVLPTALMGSANVAMGEDIYIFGGQSSTSTGVGLQNTIYKYNTKTKTLTLLETTLPYALSYHVGVAYGTSIYLFGGRKDKSTVSSNIYKYDTLNDTITRLSSTIPDNLTELLSAVLVDDKIYLFGGQYSNTQKANRILMFDATNETIDKLSATLPYYSSQLCAVAVGSKIYIFYGSASVSGSSSAQAIITQYEIFDTLTKKLSSVEKYNIKSYYHGEAIGSKIYLFEINGTIKIFDPETSEIITSSSKLPISYFGDSTLVGKNVYFVGGFSSRLRTDIMTFIVTFPLEENDILIQEGYLKNTFDLVKAPTKVEMSAQNAYIGNASGEAEFVDAYVFNKSYWKNINTEEKLPIYALSAPTDLSLSVSILSWTAVDNAKTYEIFSDGASLGTATTNSIDLSTLSSWSTITAGTHSLTVKAKSDEYLDSPASSAVTLTMYSIDTYETAGATVAESDPTTIVSGGTVTLNFTADEGETLPTVITVTGADHTWTCSGDYSTATLVLSNPTSNVTVKFSTSVQSGLMRVILGENVSQVAVKGDVDATAQIVTRTDVSYSDDVWIKGSAADATVTITCTLAEGYEIDTVKVEQLIDTSLFTDWDVMSIEGNVITLYTDNEENSGYNCQVTITAKQLATHLSAPTNVTVDGTTASWDGVENATNYELFVDGVSIGESTTKKVDMSTLSGWANVTDGSHTLTIKAKASGYADSVASEGVQFTKGASGYTVTIMNRDGDDFLVYDGQTESGSATIIPAWGEVDVLCTSGYLLISPGELIGVWSDYVALSGDITIDDGEEYNTKLVTVNSNGKIQMAFDTD